MCPCGFVANAGICVAEPRLTSSSSLTHRPPNRGLPIGVSRHAPDITVRRRATKARPIFLQFAPPAGADDAPLRRQVKEHDSLKAKDRKSTRLNSSHTCASRMPYYACKKTHITSPSITQTLSRQQH